VLGEAAADDVAEARGDLGIDAGEWRGGGGERECAAEGFAEDGAECVEVGAGVYGGFDGTAVAEGLDGGELLGRHVGGRAAEVVRDKAAGAEGRAGEVEVQEHGLAVGGEEDVGGLEVEVNQAALMGEVEGVGEGGGGPADRLGVGDAGEHLAGGAVGGGRCRLLDAVDGVEDVAAGALVQRHGGEGFKERGEGGAAEAGHAEDAEVAVGVVADGVEGDDVGVLEAGEGEVLSALERGELEHDGSVGEGGFGGEEDATVGAAGELGEEVEVADGLAGGGEAGRRAGGFEELVMTVEHQAERAGPLGEAAEQVVLDGLLAGGEAEAVLLVDQLDGGVGLGGEVGVEGEELLGGWTLAGAPAAAQLAGEVEAELLGGARGGERG
jgi:hypothetical protein